MRKVERFELEVLMRVTLDRYVQRLKLCGLDLPALLRNHAETCAVRMLVISALQAELLNAKDQVPHRGFVDDTITEWLERR